MKFKSNKPFQVTNKEPIPYEVKKGRFKDSKSTHRANNPRRPYPFTNMKVGDSFIIEARDYKSMRSASKRCTGSIWHYTMGRGLGTAFTTRAVETGLRVWRVI